MVGWQWPRSVKLTRGRLADGVLAALVMVIICMMIVPLPTWLLDLLITLNLAISILLLVTAMYVPHGLALTSMPSVLLITTLYRLSLNVSSTRLILLQADAGRVIRAFGDFVVRGDYVVGMVIFLIISLIQYLVIAKGGERVAEVAARFTLDAMPGKQLAIDADLRSGALRIEAAREKRELLERESRFYGAMDGALKFVKGDAIANFVIVGIALVGGIGVGLWKHKMTLRATLELYGLLAIGDGLVSQLPALVISIAAGLMVTRVAGDEPEASLGQNLAGQLLNRPRSLAAASGTLFALAIMPGLPSLPFVVLGLALGGLGWGLYRVREAQRSAADRTEGLSWPVIVVEVGAELATAVEHEATNALSATLEAEAVDVSVELGVPLPTCRVQPRSELDPDEFVLRVRQSPVLRGRARRLNDVAEIVGPELNTVLRVRARELIGIEDVQRWLDKLAETEPALVHNLVPRPVSLVQLIEILRQLLDEGVSVRPFHRIVESLATSAERELSTNRGLDKARRALREQISERHISQGVLAVHPIDPLVEDAVRDATQTIAGDQVVALAPELARDIVEAVRRARAEHGAAPVLLAQPDIRRSLRDVLADELPEVTVLSYAELPPSAVIEYRKAIGV